MLLQKTVIENCILLHKKNPTRHSG